MVPRARVNRLILLVSLNYPTTATHSKTPFHHHQRAMISIRAHLHHMANRHIVSLHLVSSMASTNLAEPIQVKDNTVLLHQLKDNTALPRHPKASRVVTANKGKADILVSLNISKDKEVKVDMANHSRSTRNRHNSPMARHHHKVKADILARDIMVLSSTVVEEHLSLVGSVFAYSLYRYVRRYG
jgi:hypothetical protein